MVDWLNGFFIPLIKVSFYLGIFGYITYIVIKAVRNGWTKQFKFMWKYKIMKKPYPEKTIKWCLDCVDKGIGWYDAKKILLVAMTDTDTINETMFIYDEILKEMNKQKGGKNNGRKHQRSIGKEATAKATEFPTI